MSTLRSASQVASRQLLTPRSQHRSSKFIEPGARSCAVDQLAPSGASASRKKRGKRQADA
jgi:hypothetical protein